MAGFVCLPMCVCDMMWRQDGQRAIELGWIGPALHYADRITCIFVFYSPEREPAAA